MYIGNVPINGPAVLAPMAGVADRAFRELCVSYGAAYCVTELVSSKGMTMGDRKSLELLKLSDSERPAAAQIFGNDPDVMAQAAEMAMSVKPEVIDINMGCPAPKLVKNGYGSALMKDPKLIGRIVRAVVDAVDVPVTVKIRSGTDSGNITAVAAALEAEAAGASAVTVHGRTAAQMYAPPVDRSVIREVKSAVRIPVIGNGDVADGESAKSMIEETGCDLVMVGRGAQGRPWVFSQINAYLKDGAVLPDPPPREKMDIMLSHIAKLCEYKSERIGMNEARKHAIWYTKGIRNSVRFRRELAAVTSMETLTEIAGRIVAASAEQPLV
ncbi:MAG: tRNA dihydrouridine synthase DusB [Clostridiales bacterium]|nr:tRNA dihydrouridine synthase DusB [Clostridiales bacterium]